MPSRDNWTLVLRRLEPFLGGRNRCGLYELIVERHRAGAAVVPGNREPSWVRNDHAQYAASTNVDRLLHHAHQVLTGCGPNASPRPSPERDVVPLT